MAGPILFLLVREGEDEPLAAVPNLSAYEMNVQIQALEAQANAQDKMLLITCMLKPFPEVEHAEETEDKSAV